MKHPKERRIGFAAESRGRVEATSLYFYPSGRNEWTVYRGRSVLGHIKQSRGQWYQSRVLGKHPRWTGPYTTRKEAVNMLLPARSREAHEGRIVADFDTLEHLVDHAARELGATHVSGDGPTTKIFFPRAGQYPYEAASVRRKGGYWHADGPGAREGVKSLPAGARALGGAGRRAAEVRTGEPITRRFRVGSRVTMTPDALENYGQRWQGIVFVVTSVSDKYMPSGEFFSKGKPAGYHPGFDAGSGSALYDLKIEATGEDLDNSLYDWELEPAVPGMKPNRRRGPVRAEAPRRGGAEAAGKRYAEQQIKSEHFDNWVRDQLAEAASMPEDQVVPLETPDDARKIARAMMQELEHDAKRQAPRDNIIPEGKEAEFWRGFHKYCMDSVPWLADELLTLKREMAGA